MTSATKRFGDISIEFDPSCDDAVSAALEMLAFNLSRLGAKERYARLEEIGDGALQAQVSRFVAARVLMSSPSYPKARSNGAAT